MTTPNTLIALALPLALTLSSCSPQVEIVGSGTIVAETLEIESFDKIDASQSFDVTIRSGTEFKVVLRTDDNVVPYLDVKKSGNTLDLGFKKGNYSTKNVTLEAEITMPSLASVHLSGASSVEISGFESAEPFAASLSGASSLSGELKCGTADFNLSGASKVKLVGVSESMELNTSGASSLELFDFQSGDVEINSSGASSASVNSNGKFSARTSGSSEVIYAGIPSENSIRTSGSSTVKPAGSSDN